jgi:hypothetical protein
MTAGLFSLNGFWTGVCKPGDAYNRRGYFQNELIDAALSRLYPGFIYDSLKPMPSVPEWPDFIGNVLRWEGYQGGPWLVKTSIFTWPAWLPLDPVFVHLYRDVDSTIRSCERYFPNLTCDWRHIVTAHHDEQRRVKDRYGEFDIDTTRLMGGDFAEIEAVFAFLGLPFDRGEAEAFIDRDLWHGLAA